MNLIKTLGKQITDPFLCKLYQGMVDGGEWYSPGCRTVSGCISFSPIEHTHGGLYREVYLVLDTVMVKTGVGDHGVAVHYAVRRELLQGLLHTFIGAFLDASFFIL